MAQQIHRKLRKCNTCGIKMLNAYTSHKVWDVYKQKMVYCGYMRVVNDDSKL